MADLQQPDLATQLLEFLFGRPTGPSPADLPLNRAGSIMGSAKAEPREAEARRGPVYSTIYDLIQTLNPMDWMGGMGGAKGAVAQGLRLARTAKTFKPAAAVQSTEDPLLAALRSYLQPGELSAAKNRMLPALQIAPGAPRTGENLMIGTKEGGHGPLYEQLQGMPSTQMTHGYVDPSHPNVLFNDALNTMLYDPAKHQTAVKLLQRGISPDALLEALNFTPPSR